MPLPPARMTLPGAGVFADALPRAAGHAVSHAGGDFSILLISAEKERAFAGRDVCPFFPDDACSVDAAKPWRKSAIAIRSSYR